MAKPFIKWAGGKTQLLTQFENILPHNLEEAEHFTYIEPFVGGGAMLFHMLQKYTNIGRVIINDINPNLITAYRVIRDTPERLITDLKMLQREFRQNSNEEARKELPVMLNNSEQSQKLLQVMDDALAMLPLDFESVNETYEKKLQLLTEVHQYVEGSYTIFPAQEVPDQADVLNGYQMSLFDIVSASEPEESEVEESSAEMEEVQKGEPESEFEPESVIVQEQWDENIFEYQGYHFEAVGVLPQGLEGKELVNQTRGNTELHLTAYEREDDILYSYAGFYEASGSSKADIFRCMETGRNYIPGENEY